MQQRIGHGIAAGDALIPAAERDGDLAEGPGLVRPQSDLIEDQATADERIPVLLKTHAPVRFLSVEPLLGPVDLTRIAHQNGDPDQYYNAVDGYEISCGQFQIDGLDWVIVGSESGHKARLCDVNWVRSLRDQCFNANVPFFWKQHRENGRKISTPELDGKQWVEFPV